MNMSDIPLHERMYNGFFSSADWTQLRAHPAASADLLERAGVSDIDWLNCVRQHHENMDGSGYPANLTGAQISLAARLLHVADVYCSKINTRSYRPPKSPRLAFKTLFGTERAQVDMQIASLLLRRIGLLPPGTLVRLANRETACITGIGRSGHIQSAVSFLDARGRALESPRERNLEMRAYAIRYPVDTDPVWPKINWPLLWGY